MNALLLSAGMGTRLLPLTKDWPKCLMPIHNTPILEYWLSALIALEIKNIFVNVHHHKDIVLEYLSRDRFKEYVKIVEEKELFGTAGTIRSISKHLLKEPTFVIHTDNWSQLNLKAMQDYHINKRPKDCSITMATFFTDSPSSCGIVVTDKKGVVLDFYEKKSPIYCTICKEHAEVRKK